MELNINGELAQRANPVKKGAATQNIGADDKLKIQKKDAVVESKTTINEAVGSNSPEKVDIKV
ncbi:MAG: hypothetical protein CBC29_09080 [Methylococcaceae bacterium TMED69]|nr:MAG: hypothetical protein CBC29_09080 [Methylococcaceae bacterium TMED69]|tara:strand:- start:947 stop:1135 length:189 start_codon:yes stop_codon:yes gene_type:complete